MVTLPLKRWNGEAFGVMNVLTKREGSLDQHDLALLTIISSFAALAIAAGRRSKDGEVVRLLGDIGHDLKNLLQPIVSGASLLQGELADVFEKLAWLEFKQIGLSQESCNEAIGMIERTTERIHDRVKESAD